MIGRIIPIIQGDDYDATTHQPITFTDASWPSLVGAEVLMTVASSLSAEPLFQVTCSVAGSTVTAVLTHAETSQLTPGGGYAYDVRAKIGTDVRTLVTRSLIVVSSPVTVAW